MTPHSQRPNSNSSWLSVLRSVARDDHGVIQTELPMIHGVDGRPLRVNTPPAGITPRQAAVLVVCTANTCGVDIIVTRRAGTLRQHGGEIAFPGGRFDAGDVDAVACAQREAYEEIGICADQLEILGTLHTVYVPRSNHSVIPVIAWLTQSASYRLNPAEVADVFHLPLQQILAPDALHIEERRIQDENIRVPYFPHGEHRIWGATALMLCDLIARIDRFQQRRLTTQEEQV